MMEHQVRINCRIASGIAVWLVLILTTCTVSSSPAAAASSGSDVPVEMTSHESKRSVDAQPIYNDLDELEAIKRAWNHLQGGWGKRGWQSLQSGWGKRGWQSLQSGWGKRAPIQPYFVAIPADDRWYIQDKRGWQNLQSGWGKREDRDMQNDDYDGYEQTLGSNDYSKEDKRGSNWNKLHGTWGKRDNSENFQDSESIDKREPAWNNLKGLWG